MIHVKVNSVTKGASSLTVDDDLRSLRIVIRFTEINLRN